MVKGKGWMNRQFTGLAVIGLESPRHAATGVWQEHANALMPCEIARLSRMAMPTQIGWSGHHNPPGLVQRASHQAGIGDCTDTHRHVEVLADKIDQRIA
ncbi:hypothetical protein D3C72_2155350 [compost metagenome]